MSAILISTCDVVCKIRAVVRSLRERPMKARSRAEFDFQLAIANWKSVLWSEMSELPKFVTGRLRGTQLAGEHPDADLLTAFAEKSLSEREQASVLAHLAACGDCRDVIALAVQSDLEPAPLRERAASALEPPRRWFRWPALRWGAAAACAVIVSAAVLFNTRTARKNVMPYASSDAVVSESERQTPSQVVSRPVLQDEMKARNEQRAEKPSSPAAGASVIPSEPPKSGPKAMASVGRAETDRDQLSTAASQKKGFEFGDARSAAERADASRMREKVEDSALAQAVTKEQKVTAQEKAFPGASVPLAGGKDQTGVPLADKESPEVRTRPAQVAAAAPEELKPARSAAATVPSKQDERLPHAIDAASESVEVSGNLATITPMRGEGGQLGNVMAKRAAAPRWNVTADGNVLRSLDGGKNWKTIAIDTRAVFVAVATTGVSVWAGGKGGALYHSTDSGERWTRVPVTDGATSLTSDITGLAFDDPAHGTLRTANDEVWTTMDAGKSWKRVK
jgi:hypothetical protein